MDYDWYTVEQEIRDRLTEARAAAQRWRLTHRRTPDGGSPDLHRDLDHWLGEVALHPRVAIPSEAVAPRSGQAGTTLGASTAKREHHKAPLDHLSFRSGRRRSAGS
jgi:hypothetical protein